MTRQPTIRVLVLLLACAAPAWSAGPHPKRETDPHHVPVTGPAEPGLKAIDRFMQEFVAKDRVPGAALAIAYRHRLLYAKGFGYADLETREPVRPTSLFRIASMTKPLTAVAVLQLAAQGKFQLDDPMVNVLGLDPTGDPRIRKITVRHLLQHRAGWDRDKSFDPMFEHERIAADLNVPVPVNQEQVIRFMMKQKLDFAPGHEHVYSNFGYCVLGRVIERASGQSYEAYVREHVLKPLGIHDMRLGKSRREDRAAGEVCYYDQKDRTGSPVVKPSRWTGKEVPLPYVDCLEVLDAHGGWIASAVDMARFCSAFDNPQKCPLLKPPSFAAMVRRPPGLAGFEDGKPKDVYYGCGWEVRPYEQGPNLWHGGALDGTSTLMVHRCDGYDWAVLCNTRESPDGKELSDLLDPEIHRVVDSIETWPQGNLFPKLLEPRKGEDGKARER
jgi:N-acyl-D-amino-acid deacylase